MSSESLLPHCLKVVYALTILKDLTKISVLRSLNCTLHTTYFVIFRLEDISLELLISFKTFKTSSSQHEFDIKLENIGKSSQIKNECFLPTHTSCKRVLVFEMNVQKEKYPSFKDKWTNCSL